MKHSILWRVPAALLLAAPARSAQAREAPAFFERYCLECHSGAEAEGDFDFAPLLGATGFSEHAPEWLDALDLIEDGSMPPPKKRGKIPFPETAERESAIKWARHFLAEASGTAGRPARRLNRTMYNNTIRDLIGIDLRPADRFPQDLGLHGFNNAAETQTVSPFLLDRYLEAATEVLGMAILEAERPEQIHHHYFPLSKNLRSGKKRLRDAAVDLSEVREKRPNQFKPDEVNRILNLDQGSGGSNKGNGMVREGKGRHGYEVLLQHTGDLQRRARIELSAPFPGARYRLTVHAHAEKAFDRRNKPVEPAGAALLGFESNGVLVKEVEVPVGDRPQAYAVELTTDREKTWFSFVAASPLTKGKAQRVPNIVVTEAEIEGPLFDVWPPEPHRRILGESGAGPTEDTLRRFISRAFRRPATDDEVAKYREIAKAELEAGSNEVEAIQVALQAVLVSPHFLFLIEERRADGLLNDWELASRLSYFLWSSMPDADLMELAEAGCLSDPAILAAQIERMLSDEKGESFVQSFGGQWLGFHRIAEIAPDPATFPEWDEELRRAMLGEMEHFFRHVMHENRSVLEFLDADYTFANNRLRRHYGWPELPGTAGFQRVELKQGDPRGGLMTQAGVLAVASQPTRSSPVFRGIYVAERLFNRPPPNPPAEVPELEAAAEGGGAASVREQLARHVADPNCASCHEKIDPWGLPLEAFDGIGQWREQTREELSATLPGGRAVVGPEELKEALLERKDFFVRGLAEKMLIYALGRSLGFQEDLQIQGIVSRTAESGYRLRDLVRAVVDSEAFRSH